MIAVENVRLVDEIQKLFSIKAGEKGIKLLTDIDPKLHRLYIHGLVERPLRFSVEAVANNAAPVVASLKAVVVRDLPALWPKLPPM